MLPLAALVNAGPQTLVEWILAVSNIIWIDIVLAGDNAVVIALAVRNLPARQRLVGIVLGAGAAVLLRVGLTFVASQLLMVRFVQLTGGLLVLWIATKLLKQGEGAEEGGAGAGGLWQAVGMILVADLTMSLDNVLAVAGSARGHFGLLLFGLALSIPLVVFASNFISRLMATYPVVVFLGAAILGKVAGDMILTDAAVSAWFRPLWQGFTGAADGARAYDYLRYVVEALLFATLFLFGWIRRGRTGAQAPA